MKNETLPHLLHSLAATDPTLPAIRLLLGPAGDRTITYRGLIEGAAGYALAYARAGVRPGEVAIIILDHGEELVYAFFGAILHGAVPSILPFLTEKLDPEGYARSLQALFEITTPAAVVTGMKFETEVRAALCPGGVTQVLLDAQVRPAIGVPVDALPGIRRSPDDLVLLQHSSGTTGLQKGVALTHRAVLHQLAIYREAIRLAEEDVIVSWLPLYHDMGLIAGFLLPVLSRVELVLMSPFEWVRAPYKLMQAVSRHRGTLTWMPNFAFNFCARKIRDRQLEGVDLSSWRAVINCSEPMSAASHRMFVERFRDWGLRPDAPATCYAMAENVFAVTQGGIDGEARVDVVSREGLAMEGAARPVREGEPAAEMLSAGRPVGDVEVRVVDKQRNALDERLVGELALRSACTLAGYYRRPDVDAEAFHDGWYLTGDLGYLADGEVYITGRVKDLIIVGGKNVHPQDLERLAGEVEGVHPGRVVAFGMYDEEAGTEEVVMVAEADVEDEAGREWIAEEIRRVVTAGSAVALRRVAVVERGWLVKTSSGKVARGENRERYSGLKCPG